MTIQTQVLTFAGAAVKVSLVGPLNVCARIYAEPLRTNTHAAFVGTSAVTNDGSGTGVVKELAAVGTTATTILDNFDHSDGNGQNRVDPSQWYFHGFAGEKIKVTLFFN
jgi:hypothetical protein